MDDSRLVNADQRGRYPDRENVQFVPSKGAVSDDQLVQRGSVDVLRHHIGAVVVLSYGQDLCGADAENPLGRLGLSRESLPYPRVLRRPQHLDCDRRPVSCISEVDGSLAALADQPADGELPDMGGISRPQWCHHHALMMTVLLHRSLRFGKPLNPSGRVTDTHVLKQASTPTSPLVPGFTTRPNLRKLLGHLERDGRVACW